MAEIKCLENYGRLKKMLLKGAKGDVNYFTENLSISKRTFFRLIKYLKEIEELNVQFDKNNDTYHID